MRGGTPAMRRKAKVPCLNESANLPELVRRMGEVFRVGNFLPGADSGAGVAQAVRAEAFGCRVFDKSGSREFSGSAYECEAHPGHHVVAEGYIVEILKDGRPAQPGEVGEIVIPDLRNDCLPFIRVSP